MKKIIVSAYVGNAHHSQLAMPIPLLYIAPVVPIMASLVAAVETKAAPIRYQGIFPDARK